MKSNINDALVQELYAQFCEAEGGVNHPVLNAWRECEKTFGEIVTSGEKTATINDLFYETIRYVVDRLDLKEGWDNPEK
jgi:hypothetical protein